MLRQALPISSWLDNPEGAGGPLVHETYRLLGADTLTIDAGARSLSVSVMAADDTSPTTPTYATVAGGETLLPLGYSFAVSSDWPNDELDEVEIVTGADDDVFVIVVRVA